MKVLLAKMSSMGDLIHTFPAITDAKKALPDIQFDWLVEESFAEIPLWHPAVNQVIPIALRRWRKNMLSAITKGELARFIKAIKACKYDAIIDAQGLLKSALVSQLAKGISHGMNAHSCRESWAAFFYDNTYAINKQAHAIERTRKLFAEVLGYRVPEKTLDYGLISAQFTAQRVAFENNKIKPYMVFLHSTSGAHKLWSITQWQALAQQVVSNNYHVYLPWANTPEKARATQIAMSNNDCHVLPKMNLTDIAGLLTHASATVGVDTGLAHLGAALSVNGITLYIDTHPKYTGACGDKQLCMSQIKTATTTKTTGLKVMYSERLLASEVWQQLAQKIQSKFTA